MCWLSRTGRTRRRAAVAAILAAKPTYFRYPSLFRRGAGDDAIVITLAEGVSIVHTLPQLHQTHHELLMPWFAI